MPSSSTHTTIKEAFGIMARQDLWNLLDRRRGSVGGVARSAVEGADGGIAAAVHLDDVLRRGGDGAGGRSGSGRDGGHRALRVRRTMWTRRDSRRRSASVARARSIMMKGDMPGSSLRGFVSDSRSVANGAVRALAV